SGCPFVVGTPFVGARARGCLGAPFRRRLSLRGFAAALEITAASLITRVVVRERRRAGQRSRTPHHWFSRARAFRKEGDADHAHVLRRAQARRVAILGAREAKHRHFFHAATEALDEQRAIGRYHLAALIHVVARLPADRVAPVDTDHSLHPLASRVAHANVVAEPRLAQKKRAAPFDERRQRVAVLIFDRKSIRRRCRPRTPKRTARVRLTTAGQENQTNAEGSEQVAKGARGQKNLSNWGAFVDTRGGTGGSKESPQRRGWFQAQELGMVPRTRGGVARPPSSRFALRASGLPKRWPSASAVRQRGRCGGVRMRA